MMSILITRASGFLGARLLARLSAANLQIRNAVLSASRRRKIEWIAFYVLTPQNGAWLNILEAVLGTMERNFHRQIRVQSRGELRERIRKGNQENNQSLVVLAGRDKKPFLESVHNLNLAKKQKKSMTRQLCLS